MKEAPHLKNILTLILLTVIFFIIGNGVLNLTNPDEVFYAQTAKEMAQHKTWLVPYLFNQPNFEKPVFTYWLLRFAFLLFGISSFSARLFPAVFAIIGVMCVYLLAFLGFNDKRKAFIGAFILMSSGLYVGLARTVFTDMIFSIFILLSLTSFFYGYCNRGKKGAGLVLFFIFSGCAVLTKGPLGLFLPLSAILMFLALKKDLRFLWCGYCAWGILLFAAISFPWYVFMVRKFGNGFIDEFYYNDHLRRLFEAEHKVNDTWFFYPVSALLCMFPWTIFAAASFPYFLKHLRENNAQPVYFFLFAWMFVVFAVFQAAHSKLVSYILPLFPVLAIMTGDFMYGAIRSGKRGAAVISLVSWIIFALLPVVLLFAAGKYSKYLPSKEPVYTFALIYILLPAAMLFFILKRKLLINFYLVPVQVIFILSFVFVSNENFEAYVSSKSACEYLLKNYTVENRLLCSKSLVRGVRFFTEREVAVINVRGGNFFSPHPVPYLDFDEKVKDFLQSQPVTYGILTKSSMTDMRRITSNYNFTMDELKLIGNEYVVRVRAR
jgi:4-amino-4-deoxy-L-arabinose transferase-like glycosyltransferase